MPDVGCWLPPEDVDALDALIDDEIAKRTDLGEVLAESLSFEGRVGARKHCAGAVLSRALTGRKTYDPPPSRLLEEAHA